MAKFDFTIFKPTTKDMLTEYPELNSVKEFTELQRQTELTFVWLYANKTSEIADLPDNERVVLALSQSKLDRSLSPTETREYHNLVFPSSIKMAIDKMRNYSPSLRFRAKTSLEKMFDNIEDMTKLDSDTKADMSMDEKKAYVILVQKSMEVFEEIIPQIESSYGVKETKRKIGERPAETYMDKAIKRTGEK